MRLPVSSFWLPYLQALVLAWPAAAQAGIPAAATDHLVVLPDSVNGVEQCRVSLNGIWDYTSTPEGAFQTDTSSTGWKRIQVPGEPMMQGFAVRHDVESGYRRILQIPGDFAGKRILVRFNGVYGYARVWVNGHYVREHHGGFTSWDCDITSLVTPGRTALLAVGVTDRLDDISYGSGYAKHPIGGILRSVELIALPRRHLRTLQTAVGFDSLYRRATITVEAALDTPASATLELLLYDPAGRRVNQKSPSVHFSKDGPRAVAVLTVNAPQRWDAEHPLLYTLQASLVEEGRMTEVVRRRIGLREVHVKGNKLYVNGMPVKLRGVCRHDIHPTMGRSTTPGQDKTDVLLAREANINFIRTSHYPPSQEFLDYCDEYGVYVEEETAICFVGTHRQEPYQSAGASQNDPTFSDRYLSQLGEMVERDRDHPSVIIWSIGNENEYGLNFQAEYDYVKNVDRSRPVMFSYPGKVPKDRACFDIASMHYVSFEGNLEQYGLETRDFSLPGIPVLHDEWAHVACYNTPTLAADLNVRNFWGESMKMMWDGCFASEGGIGGAIWGYIDEVFMLPDTVVGYGPWGIIDVWRRKKPEFWLTQKAYSPVRVTQTRFASSGPGEDLVVPMENRFDHTNLAELQVQVASGGATSSLRGPDIQPHHKGSMTIPGSLIGGKEVTVTFLRQGSRIVDEELLTVGPGEAPRHVRPEAITIRETDTSIEAAGKGFALRVSKKTGLIEDAMVQGRRMLLSGPFLHLTGAGGQISWSVDSVLDLSGSSWQMDDMAVQKTQHELRVSLRGRAGSVDVSFTTVVAGNGEISTTFEIPGVPERWREVGVRYVLDPGLDSLSWERNALWSLYPDDHIGRPVGSASKIVATTHREEYRERPAHPWFQDARDFFVHGKAGDAGPQHVPVDFRTTKEHITRFTLADAHTRHGVTARSDGTHAARAVVNPDGTTALIVLNAWSYANLSWGNYERVKKLASPYRGTVTLILGGGLDAR